MEEEHRDAIRRNISSLVNQTDLEVMRSALHEKRVFTEHNMETYTDTNSTIMHRKRCMFNDITRRGPQAFGALLEALEENGYWDLVRMLDPNSILNPFGNANTRSHAIEKENKFVSISNRKKSESELLNSYGTTAATVNGTGVTAVPNNNTEVPFIVHKSTKFMEDDESKDIRLYRTRGRARGVLLLFTYIEFQNNVEKMRAGADLDTARLKYLFSEIGFKVVAFEDLTLQETTRTLEELHQVLAKELESVFVVVSSHGYERRGSDTDIRCSDGQLISVLDVIAYFNNRRLPHLRDVPKVFIFQTCRGYSEDYVLEVGPRSPLQEPAEADGTPMAPGEPLSGIRGAPPPDAFRVKEMRLYDNILIAQSTLPRMSSRRDPERGSWYIQVLCELFAARAHDCHVDDLLTMVDRQLKQRFQIQTSSVDRWGFNRRLYLHPGLFCEPRLGPSSGGEDR